MAAGGSETHPDFTDTCYDRKADPEFTKPIEDKALMEKLEARHKELLAKYDAWPEKKDFEVDLN